MDQYYAIVKLGECSRTVTTLKDEMITMRAKVEKMRESNIDKAKELYKDLQNMHKKLLNTLSSAILLLLEAEMNDEATYTNKLFTALSAFNLMTTDYSKFKEAVEGFVKRIPTDTTTNAAVIGRLMNNVKMGYYPTDIGHIKMLKDSLVFPQNQVNLLDPCCGCGLALYELGKDKNAITYGVELDEYRAQEAQNRLSRVGFGSYFHSRINHDAFHVMLLNPPYLSVMNESGTNARHEKRFLVDSICHLVKDGILIYIIPYYRLTEDICRVLCDNFRDIQVYRFMNEEFSKFKQIAVLGIRQKRIDGSELVSKLSQLALKPDAIPLISDLPQGAYIIPDIQKKIDIFKGAQFNIQELAAQLNMSKSINRLFERNELDGAEKSPLLPLNIGQVGLIGGSGLINGLIECDRPHIIKGRIVKETKKEVSDNTNSRGEVIGTELKETIVNKMIFNVLTPNGFRSLT